MYKRIGLLGGAASLLCIGGSTFGQEDLAAASRPEEVPIRVDSVPAEQLAAAVADPNWKAPRTSWGDPDLQGPGAWTSDDMFRVPRERPEEFGTREHMTTEEFAERAKAEADYRDEILNEQPWFSRSWSVWTFGYTSQIVDPPNGQTPENTPQAVPQKTRGSYSGGPFNTFGDFNLYDRCITRGISSIIPSPARYGNGLYIAQSPDTVAITYEMIHETRVIKLDTSPQPGDHIRQYLGTSRGHWEGDTLVVETQNLTDKTTFGRFHNSEGLKITERFTRVDPNMIEYFATVDDPATFEAPFTYRLMLTAHPGYRVYEYSCHEGNTVVEGGLGGEREYERQVAEALAKGEPPPVHPRESMLGDLPEDEEAFINVNDGE